MSWQAGLFQMIGESVQNNKNLTATQLTNLQNRSHFKRDRAVAFDREDTALQRRVADARAAGVHPLFALGASVGSSPMFGTPAEAPRFAGDMGGAMARMAPDSQATQTHIAAIGESKARARLYNAQAADLEFTADAKRASDAARATQNANVIQDIIKVTPDARTTHQSRDPSVSAGREHPAYREYMISPYGLRMDLPYSEEGPGEALENVPFYLWPMVIQHNRAKYGDDWGTRFIQEYMYGKPPVYRPESERFKRKGSSPFSHGWGR